MCMERLRYINRFRPKKPWNLWLLGSSAEARLSGKKKRGRAPDEPPYSPSGIYRLLCDDSAGSRSSLELELQHELDQPRIDGTDRDLPKVAGRRILCCECRIVDGIKGELGMVEGVEE